MHDWGQGLIKLGPKKNTSWIHRDFFFEGAESKVRTPSHIVGDCWFLKPVPKFVSHDTIQGAQSACSRIVIEGGGGSNFVRGVASVQARKTIGSVSCDKGCCFHF